MIKRENLVLDPFCGPIFGHFDLNIPKLDFLNKNLAWLRHLTSCKKSEKFWLLRKTLDKQTKRQTEKNRKKNRRKVFYIAFTLWVQRMNQRNRHQQMQNCDCTWGRNPATVTLVLIYIWNFSLAIAWLPTFLLKSCTSK